MTDPLDRARKALQAIRQYQQDWIDHGRDRIYQYYENIDEALDTIVNLNIYPEWLRRMADAEDAVGGISIGSIDNVKAVIGAEKIKNNFIGKTIADFRQISDREVYIELDDGTNIVIKADIKFDYDENEGYIDMAFIEISES
jgi:hypothetical protein